MLSSEKAQSVSELSDLFGNAPASYVLAYQGCTCSQLTEFRKELRSTGASFAVVKNTLARRAIAGCSNATLNEDLFLKEFKGPVAVVWAKEDFIGPAKIIAKHAKTLDKLSVKVGFVDGKVVGVQDVEAIATLPSKEELLSKLLGLMNAPATRLLQTMNAPSTQLVRTIEAWRVELEKKAA
jgi:large subunit ribosomal protein L10